MALILGLVALLAGWVITGRLTSESQLVRASQTSHRQPTGTAQLVKMDPLPGMDGEMCEWVPASANSALTTSLFAQGAGSEAALKEEIRKRPPLRTIRDSYAAFSSVAVDVKNNEVVLTDENLF